MTHAVIAVELMKKLFSERLPPHNIKITRDQVDSMLDQVHAKLTALKFNFKLDQNCHPTQPDALTTSFLIITEVWLLSYEFEQN